MPPPAASPLHPALRRSFAALEANREVWRSALAECGPLLESLGNLAEQMRALASVQVSGTPLGAFPELQERLRFSLQQAADTLLHRLSEQMCRLQSVRDAIGGQLCAVQQLCQQQPLAALTERSAAVPSAADMLEWLQDAERHYRRQLLQRKALLQALRADRLPLLESAASSWRSLDRPDEDQRIADSLSRVSMFMQTA
ncbi:AFG2-interacting ribosome maturation factor [Menidia menidia]